MLKEFLTWAKLRCFSRRKKREAKNIIDCRWVIKWKHEIATTSLKTDRSQGPATGGSVHVETGTGRVTKRVTRARLTACGFKDRQAQDLDSYAGTSQR